MLSVHLIQKYPSMLKYYKKIEVLSYFLHKSGTEKWPILKGLYALVLFIIFFNNSIFKGDIYSLKMTKTLKKTLIRSKLDDKGLNICNNLNNSVLLHLSEIFKSNIAEMEKDDHFFLETHSYQDMLEIVHK